MRHNLGQSAKRPASHPGTYRDNTPRRGIHYRHLRCEQLEARRLLSIGPGPDLPEMSLVDPSTSSLSGLTTSYQLDGDGADSSGGGQAVVIQTVPVGNPGNADDIHGDGYGYHNIEDRLFNEFTEADCIVYGHTHAPACHRVGHILFINPGSFNLVGNKGTYAILEIDEEMRGTIMQIPEAP